MEVQDQTFEQVEFAEDVISEAQQAWSTFINSASSREAAGEAIYAALFDAAPSLQSLFKTARSVMALRFMNGFNSIMTAADNPRALKTQVESLGFQHLDLEVTVTRVAIFRDAIVDLFEMELGARFTSKARTGFVVLLNYAGGAFIYIRREYAGRIKVISSSWRKAKNTVEDESEEGDASEDNATEASGKSGESSISAKEEESKVDSHLRKDADKSRASGESRTGGTKIPTTFDEMFLFNSAVMGFGNSLWMNLVLDQFNDIVENVANSYRLHEECDVLSLVLAKYKGQIHLQEFKAVMLSSLRSLVPQNWDTDHEVAWGWLWDNVERMLMNLMGKPAAQEIALQRLIMSLTEEAVNYLRREVYRRFFGLAPAGQDYFKQSTTRLYWIADRVVEMTLEMYRAPRRMVEDISALGLRHVGYGIPTEFFAPFVSSAVQVVGTMTSDEAAEDAFRWSLTLISKILTRSILEGSTIVMKAINTNQATALVKAISVAPRGRRARELLSITVGTQSISPLYWAIESGSLNCARAIVVDLLTIRADRDRYYYGCDDLFARHPEVIQRLCADAASLLWPLFDGLIWRSRLAFNGERRVNYYVKHLLQDRAGQFDKALEWLTEHKDPKLIVHPVVVLFSDILWTRLAMYDFFAGRCYFMFMLGVFMLGQSILPDVIAEEDSEAVRITIFLCRVITYIGRLGMLIWSQTMLFSVALKHGNFVRMYGLLIPAFMCTWRGAATVLQMLALALMFLHEPIIWCLEHMEGSFEGSGLFTTSCPKAENYKNTYSVLSFIVMLMYWALLTDLSIFSMRMSAFLLVCGQVIFELGLFLVAFMFALLAFSTSLSALNHNVKDFAGIDASSLSMLEITLRMYPTSHFEELQSERWLLIGVTAFVIIVGIFLLNLLIAQINGAYRVVFADMRGVARLSRAGVIVSTLEQVSKQRWQRFLTRLRLDERLEFNEGDVGLAGGIQVTEPPNQNPTSVDAIRRFGGSTSRSTPWPAEQDEVDGEDGDKFERLEKLIVRATKSVGKGSKKGAPGSSSMGTSSTDSSESRALSAQSE
eukprot:TRINITY_DN6911_c0_g1_i2.p1 TRINITY_DN6911_c0_g1~~TRINITY_DN6911_c0_g1_i2.p1  ORF type:complete len:1051 (+),score=165.50 TRINITY_DN6911_c0_g1_i2:245-3397(+)